MENLKNKKIPSQDLNPQLWKKRVTFQRVTKEESLFKEWEKKSHTTWTGLLFLKIEGFRLLKISNIRYFLIFLQVLQIFEVWGLRKA